MVHGIGVNYFDAFARTLQRADDTSYDRGFAALADHRIPFARVMAGGYWPSEQRLYLSDPDEFFRRLDGVVAAAERHGIGLVLSLFWHPATVPDLVGEPVRAWGDPASRTHEHLRAYVADVISRYRTSDAVWAWEFGNEYSLGVDGGPWPVQPTLGTPGTRTSADDLSVEDVRTAFEAFATEVRRHDREHLVTSGGSIPRADAWHRWKSGSAEPDTAEQTAEMVRGDNPRPLDTVCVHAYGDDVRRVAIAARVARDTDRPLILGEFGTTAAGAEGREELDRALEVIRAQDIPLAALWVYDYAGQPEWSVTATNARSWQLRAISAANARRQPSR